MGRSCQSRRCRQRGNKGRGGHPLNLCGAILSDTYVRIIGPRLIQHIDTNMPNDRIPSLFNSLSMHVYTLCTSGPVGRELAENRARICTLGLACLQESWPVSGWILKLFVDIIDRLRRKHMGQPRSSEAGLSDSSIRAIGPGRSRRAPALAPHHVLSPPPEYTKSPSTEELAAPFTQTAGGIVDGRDPSSGLLPSDSSWGTGTSAELFPNLFVLDELFPDSDTGQVNFFDLLEVPGHQYQDWQNPTGSTTNYDGIL